MGIDHFDEARTSTIVDIVDLLITDPRRLELTEKVDGINVRIGLDAGRFCTRSKNGSKVFDDDVERAYEPDFLKRFADLHMTICRSNFVEIVTTFMNDHGFDPATSNIELTVEFVDPVPNVIWYDPAIVGDGTMVVLDVIIDDISIVETSMCDVLLDVLSQDLSADLHICRTMQFDPLEFDQLPSELIARYKAARADLVSMGSRSLRMLPTDVRRPLDDIYGWLIACWTVSQSNMFGGSEIEGIVVRNPITNEMIKIVDRKSFTQRLQRLWSFRRASSSLLNDFNSTIGKHVFRRHRIVNDLITSFAANHFVRRYGHVTIDDVITNVSYDELRNTRCYIVYLEQAIVEAWNDALAAFDWLRRNNVDERVISANLEAEQSQRTMMHRQIVSMFDAVDRNDAHQFIRLITPISRLRKKLAS